MDETARRLGSHSWTYAEQDPSALAEIARRVADVGRRQTLITYSDLVSGIDFRIRTVHGGSALRLGVPEWEDLHRAVLGDFLGRLCVDTYVAGEFMGSALVVASDTMQPSDGYRNLMRELGVLTGRSDTEFLAHWSAETRKAYDWYAKHG